MENERKYINTLKGILILLVVIGHFGQTIANNLPDSTAWMGQGIVLFIYSFHMPLFLFVSGYLSKNVEKRRSQALQDLFLPFFLYQVFVGVILLVLTKSAESIRNIFIPQMGTWYLISLFTYRMLLPELRKLRGLIVISIILTVIIGLCSFDDVFALRKTFGYLVYFLTGYFAKNLKDIKSKLNCWIARGMLLFVIFAFLGISYVTNWYNIALLVLTRGATLETFSHWYIAPVLYLLALVISSIIMMLVICATPDHCGWLEIHGEDTLPMYLSHLILFMVLSYIVSKTDWKITVAFSSFGIVLSFLLFSRSWYRKLFNGTLTGIKRLLFNDSN